MNRSQRRAAGGVSFILAVACSGRVAENRATPDGAAGIPADQGVAGKPSAGPVSAGSTTAGGTGTAGTGASPVSGGNPAVSGSSNSTDAGRAPAESGAAGAGGSKDPPLRGDFRSLGFLHGTDVLDSPSLSADGSVVVATASLTSDYWNRLEAVKWTLDRGIQSLGLNEGGPSPITTRAASASGNGNVIVGDQHQVDYRPFRYVDGKVQYLLLADLAESSSTWDVSEDGSVVVGAIRAEGSSGDDRAFRWTAETGIVKLPAYDKDEPGTESAYAISGDGRVAAGLSGNHLPVIWDAKNALHLLSMPESLQECDARDIDYDGSKVVGSCYPGYKGETTPYIATMWIDGTWHELPRLPGAVANFAYGINGDGSVVVGTSGEAAVWIDGGPARSIRGLLEDAGHDLAGWQLQEAVSVSKDGKVVVGRGSHDGRDELWIARLP